MCSHLAFLAVPLCAWKSPPIEQPSCLLCRVISCVCAWNQVYSDGENHSRVFSFLPSHSTLFFRSDNENSQDPIKLTYIVRSRVARELNIKQGFGCMWLWRGKMKTFEKRRGVETQPELIKNVLPGTVALVITSPGNVEQKKSYHWLTLNSLKLRFSTFWLAQYITDRDLWDKKHPWKHLFLWTKNYSLENVAGSSQ